MVNKIPDKAKCRYCKGEMVAQQDTMKGGFLIESYFCERCNKSNPNYKPKIMEVYKVGQ